MDDEGPVVNREVSPTGLSVFVGCLTWALILTALVLVFIAAWRYEP